MKVYILVAINHNEPTFDMPINFGRNIRAYSSAARAMAYARKFKCSVIELETSVGKIIKESK